MGAKSQFLIVVGALAIAGGATASAPLGSVVALHYSVRENNTDKLQKTVTDRIAQVMKKLERVAEINTSTSHGTVDVEIRFQGETTKQDLAAVNAQVEMLKFGDEVLVISRTVELRQPRLSFDAVPDRP